MAPPKAAPSLDRSGGGQPPHEAEQDSPGAARTSSRTRPSRRRVPSLIDACDLRDPWAPFVIVLSIIAFFMMSGGLIGTFFAPMPFSFEGFGGVYFLSFVVFWLAAAPTDSMALAVLSVCLYLTAAITTVGLLAPDVIVSRLESQRIDQSCASRTVIWALFPTFWVIITSVGLSALYMLVVAVRGMCGIDDLTAPEVTRELRRALLSLQVVLSLMFLYALLALWGFTGEVGSDNVYWAAVHVCGLLFNLFGGRHVHALLTRRLKGADAPVYALSEEEGLRPTLQRVGTMAALIALYYALIFLAVAALSWRAQRACNACSALVDALPTDRDGWVLLHDVAYRPLGVSASYAAAQAACAAHGAHVVSPSVPSANSLVRCLERFRLNVWIGLEQSRGAAEPDGGWHWADGSELTYTNWDEGGEPDDGTRYGDTGEGLAAMGEFGAWFDAPPVFNGATLEYAVVCQR